MITEFSKYKNIPDVDSVSPEFWKMCRVVNWNSVIKFYRAKPPKPYQERRDSYKLAQFRFYKNYSYEQVRKFRNEYDTIYSELYQFFYDTWLSDKYDFMPSDDGYTDLLSSIIGEGKTFTKRCIDNIDVFLKMAKDQDYVENFGYLFNIDENEYWDILAEFDPIYRDVRKYNV